MFLGARDAAMLTDELVISCPASGAGALLRCVFDDDLAIIERFQIVTHAASLTFSQANFPLMCWRKNFAGAAAEQMPSYNARVTP
jgi:hypothetical protein